ncbi:protein phosphatase 1 regulatory subunit 37 [Hyposmocoma kahamanoa]|uniref:protein phosphatase 1 regulatory subunit 37 n=1 Tax=Hyposmocoma kahamanoa TaxID=1477025 RepID=UPI000E6D8EF3|nr:protein phosphatase 1 regulatory subunit 37 [Hyposmocoma kahamanoa]
MVEYYESATAVTICGPRAFGVRGWQAVSRMIKKSCQLAELEITNHPLEANHAPVISRALHAFSCKLRVLCLQRTLLAGDPLLCLVIALKTNTSIRELRLGDNQLTASDAAQLALLLRYNTRLQLLDLSNNQIQDAGAGHIAEALADQATQTPPSATNSPMSPHQCPLSGYESRGLAFLVLWNNQLTRNCAHHLSKALTSKSLCVLNVGRNALGGEALRALGACGALVSLGLQAARLGPTAARALADLVAADHKLQRLDLRDNKLGEQGLQAILQALSKNTSLTQIDLDEPTDTSNLSAEDGEAVVVARLTREIRALCRKNEPTATSPERRVHRKISLTCHSTCIPRVSECCYCESQTN